MQQEQVTDGVIGISRQGVWTCEGVTTDWGSVRFPWIQLSWSEPQAIDKVVLYDRPSAAEHIAGGRLQFSDGAEIRINGILNDGTTKAIAFKTRKVSWIKFIITDGKGKYLGFEPAIVLDQRLISIVYLNLSAL